MCVPEKDRGIVEVESFVYQILLHLTSLRQNFIQLADFLASEYRIKNVFKVLCQIKVAEKMSVLQF